MWLKLPGPVPPFVGSPSIVIKEATEREKEKEKKTSSFSFTIGIATNYCIAKKILHSIYSLIKNLSNLIFNHEIQDERQQSRIVKVSVEFQLSG
jgi:hypothetical protein